MRELAAFFYAVFAVMPLPGGNDFASDSFDLAGGKLTVTFIGHATLMLEYAGKVIHVDPVSQYADYAALPKADIILVTHNHGDHLDAAAIRAVSTPGTVLVANAESVKQLGSGLPLRHGESRSVAGIQVTAVPAYNTSVGRDRFHPAGRDNGYILELGGRRIYIAGDTEDTAEMKALRDIWIAFLPMNQPYTMTPAQVASAAKAFRPAILYPYHFGQTDTAELVELLKAEKGIEVRIRKLA